MSAEIINGKEIAREIREALKSEVDQLKINNITPGLGVILVGNDPASHSYVRGKARACKEVGIYSEIIHLAEEIEAEELKKKVIELNRRADIHGVLVQLPLPPHINEKEIIAIIDEAKDVDGFTPKNVGNLVINNECFVPCTPKGIIELIKRSGIPIKGKNAVVVGRSNIVGKPVAMLLLHENATITMCHSHTKNLAEITQQADILVVATGKAHMISKEHVKPGAVVIDVGVNRIESGKLVGDVNFEEVKEVAGYLTPVPGGVGPMTITMLLKNTIEAASRIGRS